MKAVTDEALVMCPSVESVIVVKRANISVYIKPSRDLWPEAVYFVTKLPKTRSGKIMRRVLRAIVENTDIGDLSTMDDETAVDEVIKSYNKYSNPRKQGKKTSRL
ncbi:hypothetical protein ACFLTP_07355 [Chloroflexota bacterium]